MLFRSNGGNNNNNDNNNNNNQGNNNSSTEEEIIPKGKNNLKLKMYNAGNTGNFANTIHPMMKLVNLGENMVSTMTRIQTRFRICYLVNECVTFNQRTSSTLHSSAFSFAR